MRMALSGKLTKRLVENLGPGRHGDGGGLYLVVDPSGARRWIMRVTVKEQKNAKGAPLRTDLLDRRRALMERWSVFVTGQNSDVVLLRGAAQQK